jgi:hypothetical protein
MQTEIERPSATDYAPHIQPGGQTLKLFANTAGVILFLLGIALAIGNKTGRFVTFPFSGFTAMGLCGILVRVSNANEKRKSWLTRQAGLSPNPSAPSPVWHSTIKYNSLAEVPWFRREPEGITVLWLLVFSPALLALCIIALTGDIFRNAYDKNGHLVTWGIASKTAAILLLFTQLGLSVIYYEANKSGEIQSAQQTQVAPALQREAPSPRAQAHAAPAPASAQPDWQFDYRSFTLCFVVTGFVIFLFTVLPDRNETQGWNSGQGVLPYPEERGMALEAADATMV